jgi:hypothetical protein
MRVGCIAYEGDSGSKGPRGERLAGKVWVEADMRGCVDESFDNWVPILR